MVSPLSVGSRREYQGSSFSDHGYDSPVPTLRLFAAAREAAGTGSVTIEGDTVDRVLSNATSRFGDTFAAVLATSKVWVNGEEVPRGTTVGDNDEVAVLPPVSGGM
ncbi:MAG: hypothetical protein RLZZ544_526 [Actinomycetota bacterium]